MDERERKLRKRAQRRKRAWELARKARDKARRDPAATDARELSHTRKVTRLRKAYTAAKAELARYRESRAGGLRAGGGWGGSRFVAEAALPIARRNGLVLTSTKRSYDTVAGSAVSDHFTGCLLCYAVDISNSSGSETREQQRTFEELNRLYGLPGYKNSYGNSRVIAVSGQRFRVQVLYGGQIAHADHVHVGVRRA